MIFEIHAERSATILVNLSTVVYNIFLTLEFI